MKVIETERLLLRQYKEEDVIPFIRLNQEEEVMRYFLQKKTAQESEEMLHKLQGDIAANGFGVFAVEEKETHQFIGFIGLNRFDFETDFAPGVEIAWRLLPEFWNKGYATEGAKACIAYAKSNLELDKLYAFTVVQNKASEQVMLKIGMKYQKNFNHPLVPKDHELVEHKLYCIQLK